MGRDELKAYFDKSCGLLNVGEAFAITVTQLEDSAVGLDDIMTWMEDRDVAIKLDGNGLTIRRDGITDNILVYRE